MPCDDRRVEEHRADLVAHRSRLGRCHALEHLDVERLADAPPLREQVGRGDVEQVVAGDADPHRGRPGRVQGPVDQPQVRRVDLGLGAVRGLRPPVQLGVDLLHGQVGALDQAHLQAGAAGGAPCGRDVRQLVEGVGGVGQVRLQHDARLGVPEVRVRHQPLEHAHREGEVAVLLHVEVEEGAVPGRCRVQRAQPVDHPLDAAVGVPRGELAGHRRDLDRHVVHVGPLHQSRHARQAGGRLTLPQHGLAEQVEVQAEALRTRARPGARPVRGRRRRRGGRRGCADAAGRPARRRRAARARRALPPRASPGRAGRGSPRPRRTSGAASSRAATRTSCGRATRSTNRTASSSPAGSATSAASRPVVRRSLAGLALRRRREPGPGQPDRVLDDVVSRRHAAPSSARPAGSRPHLAVLVGLVGSSAGSGLRPVSLSRAFRATSVARMPVDLHGRRVVRVNRSDATADLEGSPHVRTRPDPTRSRLRPERPGSPRWAASSPPRRPSPPTASDPSLLEAQRASGGVVQPYATIENEEAFCKWLTGIYVNHPTSYTVRVYQLPAHGRLRQGRVPQRHVRHLRPGRLRGTRGTSAARS